MKDGKRPLTEHDRIIVLIVDEILAAYNNEKELILATRKKLTVEELVEVLIILKAYALIASVIYS